MTKVCKFGGTSLAIRANIETAIDIMLRDSSRRYMVVSAPGSRYEGDPKITKLLIDAAEEYKKNKSFVNAEKIIARFDEIIREDGELMEILKVNLERRLVNTGISNYKDNIKAFGEYASAIVINKILKKKGIVSDFFDPRRIGFKIIGSGNDAIPDANCYSHIGGFLTRQLSEICVIPGYYGANSKGQIITLPRGSSDTSGAVIARAVNASIYENWTDEDGLKKANPKIVPWAEPISKMIYDEARELAYMGFKLQDACFEPIKGKGIILQVRNTFNYNHDGTKIVDAREVDPEERIVGIASEKDCISINMRKLYAEREIGLGRKLFGVLEENGIPYEHHPSGVDSFSVIIRARYLENSNLKHVLEDFRKEVSPDTIQTTKLALVSATGLGMEKHLDTNLRILKALVEAGIKDRFADHGADDLSYTVGVDENRADDAVRAIYNEFFPRK